MTLLALFVVGCGTGGGSVSSPPPPPTAHTVSGTVSGLMGSGLTLAICHRSHGPGFSVLRLCDSQRQVTANGALTLYPVFTARYSGSYFISVTRQPASPEQRCAIRSTSFTIQTANATRFTLSCADFLEYSYVTNAADDALSSYSVDVTTDTVAVIGSATGTGGASPYAMAGFGYGDGSASYLYVSNESSNDVAGFAADTATGALTAVPGSPYPAGADPQAMALDGRYNACHSRTEWLARSAAPVRFGLVQCGSAAQS